MPANLFALCREPDDLFARRVRVNADVQNLLEGVFVQQEQDFLAGVTDEIEFDGGWKPDPHELLSVAVTPEVQSLVQSLEGDVLGLPDFSGEMIQEGNVKGLATLVQRDGQSRLLLQVFDARQVLQRGLNLVLSGETFDRLSEPAFSLGSRIAGIVEGDRLKFRSYFNIRKIFSISHLYEEATDLQIDEFSGHDSLVFEEFESLKDRCDQSIRKLITAIGHRGTLENFAAHEIVAAAARHELEIEILEGKMVMPSDKQRFKKILAFLDDGYYRHSLSGMRYLANSKRPA